MIEVGKMKMFEVRRWLTPRFGTATYWYEGERIKGILYGTDEMFDGDLFYQELLADDNKIYRVFFEIPKSQNLEDINYDIPTAVQDITDEATRFFCETEAEAVDAIADYVLETARVNK